MSQHKLLPSCNLEANNWPYNRAFAPSRQTAKAPEASVRNPEAMSVDTGSRLDAVRQPMRPLRIRKPRETVPQQDPWSLPGRQLAAHL
jgi:hypothetical protein